MSTAEESKSESTSKGNEESAESFQEPAEVSKQTAEATPSSSETSEESAESITAASSTAESTSRESTATSFSPEASSSPNPKNNDDTTDAMDVLEPVDVPEQVDGPVTDPLSESAVSEVKTTSKPQSITPELPITSPQQKEPKPAIGQATEPSAKSKSIKVNSAVDDADQGLVADKATIKDKELSKDKDLVKDKKDKPEVAETETSAEVVQEEAATSKTQDKSSKQQKDATAEDPDIIERVSIPAISNPLPGEENQGGEWKILSGKVISWWQQNDLKDQWQRLRQPVLLLAGLIAVLLALRVYSGVMAAIDSVPLLPGLLELTGVIWLIWFLLSRMIRSKDRQEVISGVLDRWHAFRGKSDSKS